MFFANNFLYKQETDMKVVPLYSAHQDGSNDMQYDIFMSGHDIDLRSKFRLDFFGQILNHWTRLQNTMVAKPLT